MRRFVSRFSHDAAGNVTAKAPRAPHCAYCGTGDSLRSMVVRVAGRLDVCETCRVNKLGRKPMDQICQRGEQS